MIPERGVVVLTEALFVTEVLEARGVVAVELSRSKTPDWAMSEPILRELATLAGARAKIARLDVDAWPGPARLFQTTVFPTVIFFRNGLELGRLEGIRTLAQYELAVDIALTALPGAESMRAG